MPVVLLEHVGGEGDHNENEQRQMFFCVQIGLLSGNVMVKNVFINAARDRKQDQRAKNHEVMAHERVGEKYQQYNPDCGMENVLSETDFAATKVKGCVFARVVNKREKRQHQNGGSHQSGLFQADVGCQSLVLSG